MIPVSRQAYHASEHGKGTNLAGGIREVQDGANLPPLMTWTVATEMGPAFSLPKQVSYLRSPGIAVSDGVAFRLGNRKSRKSARAGAPALTN